MANVTIDQLTLTSTVSSNYVIPITDGTSTYKTYLSMLSSLPFIPKAMVRFNGTNLSIQSRYNVASVTSDSTGLYRVNYQTSIPNGNLAIPVGFSGYGAVTANTELNFVGAGNSYIDVSVAGGAALTNNAYICMAVFVPY